MSELKPCPLCRGVAYFERRGTPRQSAIIKCEDCGLVCESSRQQPCDDEDWNSRPIEDSLRAKVERLMGVLRDVGAAVYEMKCGLSEYDTERLATCVAIVSTIRAALAQKGETNVPEE